MNRWDAAPTFGERLACFFAALGTGILAAMAGMVVLMTLLAAHSDVPAGMWSTIHTLILVFIFVVALGGPPAALLLLLLLLFRVRSLALYVLAGMLAAAPVPTYLMVNAPTGWEEKAPFQGLLVFGLFLLPGAVAGLAVHSYLFQRWTIRQ